ncbi:Gmad2 immunoglobulin-like domain-containing protein [Nocardioides mangrovi]|uniref:Gmad2 immunoglobulin-like domain-containing protein n=1 Tax=Nocardioides mangrovi TaxID=2874580 RepID=A0ABS7UJT8_9ACTN|nr:Gmad2 immunoglobulin-like domain-containing protein [Nocardioides mangrovi]MBZ5741050.1 Gmad2 immunoglobulin-like domain-containing protein [Nocardioides mangrovi]
MTRRTRLAVVLTTSLLAAGGLAGCNDSGDDQSPASGPTKHHTRATDGGATDDAGDDGGSDDSGDTTTVPVYFVGDTPQGTRLYREFRKVAADGSAGAALSLAASGDALDPDYGTLLPAGTFGDITYDEQIVVPLPDDSWTRLPDGMSERDALMAIQQIVYTVQGVLQRRSPVVFTDGDGNQTQIFGVASEDGFSEADPIRTLALMSVTSPETDQSVSGTLHASGVGSSFEANVVWRIQDAGGDTVKDGSATAAGWMDKLYPWSTDIDVSDLDAGTYTFVASTDDPSGGEGAGPTVDTKEFTVG